MRSIKHINSKGQDYFLHQTVVTLRGGKTTQTIYYFAKKQDPKRATEMPAGYRVVENGKTGLPVLKKA